MTGERNNRTIGSRSTVYMQDAHAFPLATLCIEGHSIDNLLDDGFILPSLKFGTASISLKSLGDSFMRKQQVEMWIAVVIPGAMPVAQSIAHR